MSDDHTEEVDEHVAALLAGAEQRYTSGRRKLITALRKLDGPATITQILETDTSLAQSSAYRNLTVLEEVGVVTRIVTGDDFAHYELAEHLTGHHHHLICSSCGDVSDFELSAKVETNLDKALQTAAAEAGFNVDNHRLDLLGVCSSCS